MPLPLISSLRANVICAALVYLCPIDGFLRNAAAGELSIENSRVTVKIASHCGGAITWISQKRGPNLVNTYDVGRLIQQSYYAGAALDLRNLGQSPSWSPWPWNPIQGGSFKGSPSIVEEFTSKNGVLYGVDPVFRPAGA
jgi:hypothetical protein